MTDIQGESWVRPDAVFDGQELRPGACLCLRGGSVARITGAAPKGARVRNVAGTISPGFVDLQVNGGGGALLNAQPTPEAIATIRAAHHRLGTAAIMPTVITDEWPVLEAAAAAALDMRGQPGILGLHIEGPHIAPARRGTHAAAHVRPFEPRTLRLVERLRAADLRVMVTLAPEAAEATDIAALADLGAVVSIGHSDATAEQTRAALAAGASAFTHLFNAMSPMLNRAPGVVGAAINSQADCGIICDGFHVADEMVGLAIRARPRPDAMFLVSDAMPTVGGPDRFELYGQEIRLSGGRLVNAEGSLAGSHTTMAQSLARLIGQVGIAPEVALRMAVSVPARVIGAPGAARLEGRPLDEVVWLDPDWQLRGTLAEALAPLRV